MSDVVVKTHHYVSGEVLVHAAWEVQCDPKQRLSKKAVLALVTRIYASYGDQVNSMEWNEYDKFFNESYDWTDRQREKITEWVEKQWPGATND